MSGGPHDGKVVEAVGGCPLVMLGKPCVPARGQLLGVYAEATWDPKRQWYERTNYKPERTEG